MFSDSQQAPKTPAETRSSEFNSAHDGHNHGGDHSSCGGHSHSHTNQHGPALIASLIVTVIFVAGEAVAGYLAHSLALMSDAGHNFSDALSLGLSAYAVWVARKPANSRKTFGYHRVAILAALVNSASLAALSIGILWGAIREIGHPTAINSPLMIIVAAVALVVNSGITWALHGGAQHSLNMRATYIHMVTDVVSSILVLAAAFVIKLTGLTVLDPLVSIVIAAIIVISCWNILREATDILLEGTPRGLNVEAMVADVQALPQVTAMHDLHVWTVSDGMNYLSCHIEVAGRQTVEECAPILEAVNEVLLNKYGIGHTTVQLELSGLCIGATETNRLFCGGVSSLAEPVAVA